MSAVSPDTAVDAEGTVAAERAVVNDTSAALAATIRVNGDATPEEIAALVAVLSALGHGAEPPAQHGRSAWSDPSWRLVGPSRAHGGWRSSGLPR
ncbi:acyl-CoA carboxylase subunit epsilon [Terrabacter sp. 2RAF25]|uniref:acyl-CoA carboxylase subunit epsilon n=1 Tax=Terrabacter sp. 2RAF25 TaxID=3232998 RepID=UPI003F95867A